MFDIIDSRCNDGGSIYLVATINISYNFCDLNDDFKKMLITKYFSSLPI